jgi:hypothetical protein
LQAFQINYDDDIHEFYANNFTLFLLLLIDLSSYLTGLLFKWQDHLIPIYEEGENLQKHEDEVS